MAYAENTKVPVDRSIAEIRKIVTTNGGGGFLQAESFDGKAALIGFDYVTESGRRTVRFVLPMPEAGDRSFTHTLTGRPRTAAEAERHHQQAIRQKWRGLALIVKSKFEAVESGIVDFESEFLAHIVLPDGETMGQWAKPQIAAAYHSGIMPQTVLGLPSGDD